jgi:hypothetical protein
MLNSSAESVELSKVVLLVDNELINTLYGQRLIKLPLLEMRSSAASQVTPVGAVTFCSENLGLVRFKTTKKQVWV